MVITRKKYQGVLNIVKFNWHQYVIVAVLILLFLSLSLFVSGFFHNLFIWGAILAFLATVVSLLVSYYVYDYSNLYELDFVEGLNQEKVLNISAGFDETSDILLKKFPHIQLTMADFYDPHVHTEVSIKRARLVYPSHKDTMSVNTDSFPFRNQYFDRSICIFSAHEIRNEEERIQFLREIKNVTNYETGQIIITEHLRDFANFLAFNVGFLHFYSLDSWKYCFREAGLELVQEKKINPFVSTFILRSNGTAN